MHHGWLGYGGSSCQRPQDAELVAFGIPQDLPAGAVIDVIGTLSPDGESGLDGGLEVRGAQVEMQSVLPTLGLRHGQEKQSDAAGAEVHVAVGVDAHLSAYEPLPPRGQRGRVRAVDADTLDPLFEERDAF